MNQAEIVRKIQDGIWECLEDRPDVSDPDGVYAVIMMTIGSELKQIEYGIGIPNEYK